MNQGQPIHLETCPPVYTTVTRVVPRHVCCEHCGAKFIYEMTRMGYGEATGVMIGGQLAASPLAFERAVADLARELATGAEAVPCPQCFKYQSHMTAAARKLQWGWMKHLGGQVLVAMPVVMFLTVLMSVIVFPGNTELALYVAGGTAILFLVAGLITGVAYWLTPCKPNSWSESFRMAQATELACTREVFGVASLNGGPFAEDLTYGREEEYKDVLFLWVLREEIASEDVVSLRLADGREVDVELSADDHDGVFLHEDRVDDPDDEKREYRICLRVFDVYRPQPTPTEMERS